MAFSPRWVTHEPVRLGTLDLLPALRQAGHVTWIYTTSFRKPFETKLMFWLHGVRIKRVINTDIHRHRMREFGEAYKTCTKYPPAFGIDLLFDDSEGVLEESHRYGFQMVLLRPEDIDWVTTVQKARHLNS